MGSPFEEPSLFQSKDEPEGSEGQANWGRSFRDLNLSQVSSSSRGGGNVGIGSFDFQGLWEGRETALSFSGLPIDRHFLRPLSKPAVLSGEPQLLEQLDLC